MPETTAKERPIIFSSSMVRAILEGRKTQTRRVVKPQPQVSSHNPPRGGKPGEYYIVPDFFPTADPRRHVVAYCERVGTYHCMGQRQYAEKCCPYGKPGDLLWCRESFHILDRGTERGGAVRTIVYTATGDEIQPVRADHPIHQMQAPKAYPSIFMPRWASRLTLRLTDVRVERLQAISEEDAVSEGLDGFGFDTWAEKHHPRPDGKRIITYRDEWLCGKSREYFARLWDSINGKRAGCSWEANPWCWVLSFEVVKDAKSEARP